jgi:hypothetical protein
MASTIETLVSDDTTMRERDGTPLPDSDATGENRFENELDVPETDEWTSFSETGYKR